MLGVNVEDKVFERRIEQARLNPRRRPDGAVTNPGPLPAYRGEIAEYTEKWEELWKNTKFWVGLDPSVRAHKITRGRARYECLLELSKQAIEFVKMLGALADDGLAPRVSKLQDKLRDMQEQYATNPDVVNLDHYARNMGNLIRDTTGVDLGVPDLLTLGYVTELLEIRDVMQETVLEMSFYLAGSQLWWSTRTMRYPVTSARSAQTVVSRATENVLELMNELGDTLGRLEPHVAADQKDAIIERMRELGLIKAAFDRVLHAESALVLARAEELQKDPLLYKAWAKRRGRRSRKPE